MLKVKSFKMSDDAGMNDLLSKNPLASGAQILVSNGEVVIPYEDGTEPGTEQRKARLLELRNQDKVKIGLMIHSQRVLEIQVQGIEKEISNIDLAITAPGSKDVYDKNKQLKAEKERLENVLTQTKNQMLLNQAELTRLTTNVAVFDETISQL